MSNPIQVLPPELVNRIAAGEVVERPASVVKELVENSLDAGARRIFCHVEGGGSKLIRVMDDGEGMGPEDLALSVVSHATSKIAVVGDLDRILTLGFRGEALPSIAAVSRLRITSRRKEDNAGTELRLEGGGEPRLSEVGAPVGTHVEVSDLFFNTPARRKFLRTTATEMTHVQGWITRLALMAPGVHLRLEHGERALLDAASTTDFAQRATMVLGREVFEHLHPLKFGEGDITIEGLVSDPELSHRSPREIFLFVNGRYVRDRLLQHAVMQGYQTVLPGGRFPVAVLHLRMDPASVDVNVHPQKVEVRFARGEAVHQALSSSIAGVLSRSPWIKGTRTYQLKVEPASEQAQHQADRVREALQRYHTSPAARPAFHPGSPSRAPYPALPLSLAEAAPAARFAGFRFLGTLWDTYLLFGAGDLFVVVDQHAAHERVTFEKLRSSMLAGRVSSQRLLVPVQLALEASLLGVLEAGRERLAELGFEAEPFGDRVVNVTAVPSLLAGSPVIRLFRDTLDELAGLSLGAAWAEARLDVLSRIACHASVRAGQVLGEQEAFALLAELEKVDFASRCPHGRPVLAEITRAEVERWFHRG